MTTPYSDDISAQRDVYNGVEYRSKLESKTAQAFDNLGIPYRYESDGYKLTNGMWYRPDFFLPDARQFVECKGVMSSEDSAKIVGLVEDMGMPVLVLSYDNAMLVQHFWDSPDERIAVYTEDLALVRCVKCGTPWFVDMTDSYACRHCGAHDGDSHLVFLTRVTSGQQFFRYGQSAAASKPIYQEIANKFNG